MMFNNSLKYHIGFSRADLGENPPALALLSGDPERARRIAMETEGTRMEKILSENRGLNSYLASLQNGMRILSATSGMGAPSLSIVVNELFDVGIRKIIRVGTSGSIQSDVRIGSIVISRAALCRQGAANDIAPVEYPAAADPFLTVALVNAARELAVDWHMGITASVDTFYEGQGRTACSANKTPMSWLSGLRIGKDTLRAFGLSEDHLRALPDPVAFGGINEEYRCLNILNYEMEAGTLFKMAGVYGFAAACVCAVIADRTAGEDIDHSIKRVAEENAIRVALRAVQGLGS